MIRFSYCISDFLLSPNSMFFRICLKNYFLFLKEQVFPFIIRQIVLEHFINIRILPTSSLCLAFCDVLTWQMWFFFAFAFSFSLYNDFNPSQNRCCFLAFVFKSSNFIGQVLNRQFLKRFVIGPPQLQNWLRLVTKQKLVSLFYGLHIFSLVPLISVHSSLDEKKNPKNPWLSIVNFQARLAAGLTLQSLQPLREDRLAVDQCLAPAICATVIPYLALHILFSNDIFFKM